MAYHPRIETKEYANLITTRSLQERLWFVNNPALEEEILKHVAKCANRYEVKLFALALEGNHVQGPSQFPKENRADYMRDLNSAIAKAVPRYTEHGGGRFWGRRYSNEFLARNEDIEKYFFYTVLQPVQDGLVPKISEYPGYNCFHDAVWGIKRKYRVVDWTGFNARRKRDPGAKIQDYSYMVELKYERLPGYEHLSRKEYAELMMVKLEARRQEILAEREAKGLTSFVGRENLLKTARGAKTRHSKKSNINDHRPRILSVCDKTRAECKAWYFDIYFKYKAASRAYRCGELNVVFPYGTYPPHLPRRLKPETAEAA